MTVEQRKIDLINLITTIDNESLLIRMEELVYETNSPIPEQILDLLERSHKSSYSTEHRSVREFLTKNND